MKKPMDLYMISFSMIVIALLPLVAVAMVSYNEISWKDDWWQYLLLVGVNVALFMNGLNLFKGKRSAKVVSLIVFPLHVVFSITILHTLLLSIFLFFLITWLFMSKSLKGYFVAK